jgi:hypothetical protein
MRVNAWVDKPSPPPSTGNPWRAECRTDTSLRAVDAPTQEMAQDALQQELGPMVTIDWHFGPAPRPARRDGAPQPDKALEHDMIPYASLAKRFHPDLCGKRKFDAHTIMSIINELRDTTRAPK